MSENITYVNICNYYTTALLYNYYILLLYNIHPKTMQEKLGKSTTLNNNSSEEICLQVHYHNDCIFVYQSSLICISLIPVLHVLTVYLACKTKLNIYYTAVIYPSFHCVQLPVGYTTRNLKHFFLLQLNFLANVIKRLCSYSELHIEKKYIHSGRSS